MNREYPSEIRDYSKRLGVSRDATYDEIKTAYREKALEWHPDKNPEIKERAHLEFIAVSEAFEILAKIKDKNKEQLGYSSKAERGTYEYYSNLFDKIFQGEFFNSEMSSELKTLIKIFSKFR